MPAPFFDAWTWVHTHLTASLPSLNVTPESHATDMTYPALIWSLSLTQPDDLGIWQGNLTANLLCHPTEAPTLLHDIYAVIKAWKTPGPAHDTQLTLSSSAATEDGASYHQYTSIWTITWVHPH